MCLHDILVGVLRVAALVAVLDGSDLVAVPGALIVHLLLVAAVDSALPSRRPKSWPAGIQAVLAAAPVETARQPSVAPAWSEPVAAPSTTHEALPGLQRCVHLICVAP